MKKDSQKSFQASDQETGWGGFLVDEDAAAALPLLDRAVRAKAHADADIVAEAWDEQRTIVTSNGRDFVRFIQEFQNPPNNPNCRDLWGLLVVPNAHLVREKAIELVRRGLDIPKCGILRWPGAAIMNLYIRPTASGTVEIHRFKRCPFCEHPERGITIAEPWNTWYRSLPVVGGTAS